MQANASNPGIIFSCIVFAAIFGCRQRASEAVTADSLKRSETALSFHVTDTLVFELDSLTSPKNWMFQFRVLDQMPYFIVANTAINALQAYNLNTARLEKVIRFSKQGPEANRLRENFFVHTWDSIFFLDGNKSAISVFDSASRVKGKWTVRWKPEHDGYTLTTQEYYFLPFFDKARKTISFWIYPPTTPYTNEYFKLARAVEYNLSDSSYAAFGAYPDNYFSETGTHVVLRPVNGLRSGDKYILHYGASPLLHIYNANDKAVERIVNARSEFIPGEIPALETSEPENMATYEETVEYYLTNSTYEGMFANEDGSLHYRVVKHGGPLKDPDGKVRNNNQLDFSIMIFDENFDLIEELKFPGSTYDFRQCFAYGKRLYVCLNNPLNENFGEDALVFQVWEGSN